MGLHVHRVHVLCNRYETQHHRRQQAGTGLLYRHEEHGNINGQSAPPQSRCTQHLHSQVAIAHTL